MSPTSGRLLFIDFPQPGEREARGLQKSQARAHAARVGHQRVRARQSADLHCSSSSASSVDSLARAHANINSDRNVVVFRLQHQALPKVPGEGTSDTSPKSSDDCAISSSDDGPESSGKGHAAVGSGLELESDPQSETITYTVHEDLLRLSFEQPATPVPLYTATSPSLRPDDIFSYAPQARREDSKIVHSLQYYTLVLNRCFDISSYVFDVSNHFSLFPRIVFGDCFYDVSLLIVLTLQDQLQSPGSAPSAEVLRRRGKAMAKVRQKLAATRLGLDGAVDDDTLLAMTFLGMLEGFTRNATARDLHRKTISWIISQAGGLKSLEDGTVLKGVLTYFDTFTALETGSTMFPGDRRRYDPVYPPRPFSIDLCSIIATLPDGYEALFSEGKLSCDILGPLQRATALTQIASTQTRADLLAKTRTAKKTYNDFWDACPCLTAPEDECCMLEKLLSLSLLGFCSVALGPRATSFSQTGSRVQLTRRIILYTPTSPAEEECLIWMWIVVIDSWRTGDRLQPDGTSLLYKLQSRYPWLREFSKAKDLGSRFLWTNELELSVRSYWGNVLSSG